MTLRFDQQGRAVVPGGQLTAMEVDQLIFDLAVARVGMEPPVPLDPRQDLNPMVHNTPLAYVVRFEGSVRIGLRHGGLGWCVIAFSNDEATRFRDMIDQRLDGAKGVDSLNRGVTNPHKH